MNETTKEVYKIYIVFQTFSGSNNAKTNFLFHTSTFLAPCVIMFNKSISFHPNLGNWCSFLRNFIWHFYNWNKETTQRTNCANKVVNFISFQTKRPQKRAMMNKYSSGARRKTFKQKRLLIGVGRSHLHFSLNCQHNDKKIKNKMFEVKKLVTQPIYYKNYTKTCLLTALTRSAIRKTTRKKSKQQNKQKQNFFSECAKRRENKNIDHSQHFFENAYCPTNKTSVTTWYQRKHSFWVTRIWMESFNDENKLEENEKKNKKHKKSFEKTIKIIKFNTICYKLTALSDIIHPMLY